MEKTTVGADAGTNISRRGFVGAVGAAVAALGSSEVSVVEKALADEATDVDQADWIEEYRALCAELDETNAAVQAAALNGAAQASVLAMVDKNWVDPLKSCADFETASVEVEPEGDLTLPDGRIVPAVYVALRNHLNRVAAGFGNIPGPNSYDLLMKLWSEDDAQFMNAMPVAGWFTALDMSSRTGETREACLEKLEDFAKRDLILRARRSGQTHFAMIPHINGIWEFTELQAFHDAGGDPSTLFTDVNEPAYEAVRDIVWPDMSFGIRSSDDRGKDLTFPVLHSFPISKDVVEGELAPYMDWEKVIESNEYITVSPCQCRLMWHAVGANTNEQHPTETCLSFGEMAAYFDENGIGCRIDQEEAREIVNNGISHGMVPECLSVKDVDIMCVCHGECCLNAMSLKSTGGGNPAWKNWSAYVLEYDREACIGCGACVDICPMGSITFGEDGACIHDATCWRCGHCVNVCPANARILRNRKEYPEIGAWPEKAEDYVEFNEYLLRDRINRGLVHDYTGTSIID